MYYAELDLPRIEKKHRNGLMDGNIARIFFLEKIVKDD